MALSSDNVQTIRQYAGKFEKWAGNLSYSTSPAENLWAELTLLLYPQSLQEVASWLANIPAAGQNIEEELVELSKLIQEIDAWRSQGVYPEDLGDFCARNNRLIKVTRSIISMLRNMSDSDESEPPETKSVTAEKSDTTEIREIKSASAGPARIPYKALSKEALMAYRLHYETGLAIHQVAKKMTAELKLDKALRPWQIARWIKQVESLRKRTQIPIRSIAPRTSGTKERTTQFNVVPQNNTKKT